jgi:hypothetical protein
MTPRWASEVKRVIAPLLEVPADEINVYFVVVSDAGGENLIVLTNCPEKNRIGALRNLIDSLEVAP